MVGNTFKYVEWRLILCATSRANLQSYNFWPQVWPRTCILNAGERDSFGDDSQAFEDIGHDGLQIFISRTSACKGCAILVSIHPLQAHLLIE